MGPEAGEGKDEGCPETPRLSVRGLGLDLSGRRVLEGISFEVRRGETLCVLGPSGAGKTMLLRALVRLVEPTSGEVLMDGRDVRELAPQALRRRVGLVPSQPSMLEGSVEENLRYGPQLAGVAPMEIGERIRRAIGLAALEEGFLFRRADKLSAGERQRVAMARAHALQPEVLLLDEPTAALDPRTRRSVEEAITNLKREEGLTMVIVTHDVGQSERLGDRTVLMRQGRVVAQGPSRELMDQLDKGERKAYLGELERWGDDGEEVDRDG